MAIVMYQETVRVTPEEETTTKHTHTHVILIYSHTNTLNTNTLRIYMNSEDIKGLTNKRNKRKKTLTHSHTKNQYQRCDDLFDLLSIPCSANQ